MSHDSAIQAVRDDMNRLRGRMFEAVEATGLPGKQEDALKRLIRRCTYDTQADLESVLREMNNAR